MNITKQDKTSRMTLGGWPVDLNKVELTAVVKWISGEAKDGYTLTYVLLSRSVDPRAAVPEPTALWIRDDRLPTASTTKGEPVSLRGRLGRDGEIFIDQPIELARTIVNRVVLMAFVRDSEDDLLSTWAMIEGRSTIVDMPFDGADERFVAGEMIQLEAYLAGTRSLVGCPVATMTVLRAEEVVRELRLDGHGLQVDGRRLVEHVQLVGVVKEGCREDPSPRPGHVRMTVCVPGSMYDTDILVRREHLDAIILEYGKMPILFEGVLAAVNSSSPIDSGSLEVESAPRPCDVDGLVSGVTLRGIAYRSLESGAIALQTRPYGCAEDVDVRGSWHELGLQEGDVVTLRLELGSRKWVYVEGSLEIEGRSVDAEPAAT